MENSEVEINGRKFGIVRMLNKNKNASARLREGRIVISIPQRWPNSEKLRVETNLLQRAIRSIEIGKWQVEKSKKIIFFHGQMVTVMGKRFRINFVESERFGSCLDDEEITIKINSNHPQKDEIAAKRVKSIIVNQIMTNIKYKIESINNNFFQAEIPRISIRENVSRWGSCSKDGSIMLNFKLFFMPEEILDYVIVHELSHTRHRNHGKRFWSLVERIMPDYKERRKWLRENGPKPLQREN